jgi:hypothetical protein
MKLIRSLLLQGIRKPSIKNVTSQKYRDFFDIQIASLVQTKDLKLFQGGGNYPVSGVQYPVNDRFR